MLCVCRRQFLKMPQWTYKLRHLNNVCLLRLSHYDSLTNVQMSWTDTGVKRGSLQRGTRVEEDEGMEDNSLYSGRETGTPLCPPVCPPV